MKYALIASIAIAGCAVASPLRAQTAADSAAIRATALDYSQGWYAGDADRMGHALHPDLVKRIVRPNPDGSSRLDNMDATMLVEATRRGGGKMTPPAQQQTDVAILDIFGNAASVRGTMGAWIDYMHLAKFNGKWVIVNVLWEFKPAPAR